MSWRCRSTWLLAVLLLASALGSPGWHTHDHAVPADSADCGADHGVHLADHPDAPDLSAHHGPCLACAQRSSMGLGPESLSLLFDSVSVPHLDADPGSRVCRTFQTLQPRAPPQA